MSASPLEEDETFELDDSVDEIGVFNDTAFWGEGNESKTPKGTAIPSRTPSLAQDNFLSSLLQDHVLNDKSEALRKMSTTVKAMSRMSFRKKSMGSGQMPGLTAEQAEGLLSEAPSRRQSNDNEDMAGLAANFAMSMSLAHGPGSSVTRQKKRLLQLAEQWINSGSGSENVTRVKQMKDILLNNASIAEDFLSPEQKDTDEVMHHSGEGGALLSEGSVDFFATPSENNFGGCHQQSRKASIKYSVVGLAYKMLNVVLSVGSDASADSKASQAFDVLCAAANAATEFPEPLPHLIFDALDKVILLTWRPPLTSFFALRLIIILAPKEAIRYCRHVLLNCLHFQFRVLDAAMVCVAEDAIDGTLKDPLDWVEPVLCVVRFITSTTMSQDLLMLAVDVLSYTFGCGFSSAFVEQEGISVMSEALYVLDATKQNRDVIRRVLKLINPQLLCMEPTNSNNNNNTKSSQGNTLFDGAAAARAFQASPEPQDRYVDVLGDRPSESPAMSEYCHDPDGGDGSIRLDENTASVLEEMKRMTSTLVTFEPPVFTTSHFHQIINAVMSVVHKFGGEHGSKPTSGDTTPTSQGFSNSRSGGGGGLNSSMQSASAPHALDHAELEEIGLVIEECSFVLFSVMHSSFQVCLDENAVASFCRIMATSPPLWKSKSAMRATLSIIQSFLSMFHSDVSGNNPGSPKQDILLDHASLLPQAHQHAQQSSHTYKISTASTVSNAASPNYYRPIMDAGIIAALSVSLRCFASDDVTSNPLLQGVYKVIHTVCLTEPAKSSFLKGCTELDNDDDDEDSDDGSDDNAQKSGVPPANALIPCLVYCMTKTNVMDHQRYSTMVLYKLCKGASKEFCSQVLGPLPPNTLITTATKTSVKLSGSIMGSAIPRAMIEDGTAGTVAPVGAMCKALGKKLGTWNPQLIPALLGLCRELCKFISFPHAAPQFQKNACESMFNAIQSTLVSFATDPNIVATACVALGHLCRCPHGVQPSLPSAQGMTSPSDGLSQFAAPRFPGANDALLDIVPPTPQRSATVALPDINANSYMLLKFGLERGLLDLALSLVHGTFVEDKSPSRPHQLDNSDVDANDDELPSSQLPTPAPPAGEANSNATDASEDASSASPTRKKSVLQRSRTIEVIPSDAIVFSNKLPPVVKVALAYLFASISVDADTVPTLREEGMLALIEQVLSDIIPTALHESLGAKKDAVQARKSLNSATALLARDDRDFIKKQLSRVQKMLAEQEANKLPPKQRRSSVSRRDSDHRDSVATATPHGDPSDNHSFSSSAVSPTNASGGGNAAAKDAILQLSLFFAKQQAAVIAEYEHRRVVEIEDELNSREFLKSQLSAKIAEIAQRESKANQLLQRERLEFEKRWLESRQQVDAFQQEQFMEIVSYNNKSLQKKLTMRWQQRSSSQTFAQSPYSLGLGLPMSRAGSFAKVELSDESGPEGSGELRPVAIESTGPFVAHEDAARPETVPTAPITQRFSSPSHSQGKPTATFPSEAVVPRRSRSMSHMPTQLSHLPSELNVPSTLFQITAATPKKKALSEVEAEAMAQLEQLKHTLNIQASSGLASLMEAITATHAAVKQLQHQQDLLQRELVSSPNYTMPQQNTVPTRPASALPSSLGRYSHPRRRKHNMSSASQSNQLEGEEEASQGVPAQCAPPSTRTPLRPTRREAAESEDAVTPDEVDVGIYDDKSPSPAMMVPDRPLAATPPPTRSCNSVLTTAAVRRPLSATSPRTSRLRSDPAVCAVSPFNSFAQSGEVIDKTVAAPRPPTVRLAANGRIDEIIADLLNRRVEITVLDLSRNYLGDAGLLALLPTLTQLPNLEVVLLERNGISAASLVPLISEVLANAENLSSLDVSFNRDITPRVGRDLIALLKSKKRITQMNVNGTQLFESTKAIIADIIRSRDVVPR